MYIILYHINYKFEIQFSRKWGATLFSLIFFHMQSSPRRFIMITGAPCVTTVMGVSQKDFLQGFPRDKQGKKKENEEN